ncbi:hypothetical protein [Novipirellula artificiosorum]|uniref:Competence protein A n=1 Tax=Novipirellula artificiosorum TaxID=2528016 RepID=A0A5C6DJZ9_9BACT|nr:hypothetical protein [Novipirellula artificiosorum]TWU37068.1 hypothetical protein Poly41_31940 [Novipirellula artificiosorum]
MTKPSARQNNDTERSKLFGLWIENRLLQVAVATPTRDGRYRLEIDAIACPDQAGWLMDRGLDNFTAAIETLVDRHEMRRGTVAVSLDGDFCVSRIAMGSPDAVNRELVSLEERVPRYLQLGPGRKATGRVRERVDEQTEYAITSVVNHSFMRVVYDVFRDCDVEIAWVEPSLVSVARLISQTQLSAEHPVLIADGTGSRWDVGIVYEGRLILDYRPAAADTAEAFHAAIDGHIERLHRFCHRYLGIHAGQLDQMVICGDPEKVERTASLFLNASGIDAVALRVPKLESLYEISDDQRLTQSVPAVASVLPLILGITSQQVPDLLTEVRRAPDLPWWSMLLRIGWPAIAAALLLMCGYGILQRERNQAAELLNGEPEVKATVVATQARMTVLAQQREWIDYLQSIEQQTAELDWNVQLMQITQSLPNTACLNEFRVEDGTHIRLDGSVFEERMVYEILEQLRHLPGIAQVALHATNPDTNSDATRFVIRLTMASKQGPSDGDVERE